jgi:hypothetical protein
MDSAQSAVDELLQRTFQIRTMEEYKEFEARCSRHGELMEDLLFDWYYASEQLDPEDFDEIEQLHRRTLVRTLFAWIEGSVFAMKREVLEHHKLGRLSLSVAECAILREESYTLRDSGDTDVSPSYAKLLPNIKFTFPIYARAWGKSFEFDPPLSAEPRWQKLHRAYQIRNRLMHPKSMEQLAVSDSDLEDVLSGASWFEEQLDRLDDITFEVLKELILTIQEASAKDGAA